MRGSLAERFWTRVDQRGPDDCWNWTGGHSADGRGQVWNMGRNIPAPRAALMLSGVAIPHGAIICHRCDNPPCVNPAHLYAGSHLENVRDMDARGRRVSRVPHPASRGERNHNAKLTDDQIREIRSRYSGIRGEQSALAREFGVTQSLIYLIVRKDHRANLL